MREPLSHETQLRRIGGPIGEGGGRLLVLSGLAALFTVCGLAMAASGVVLFLVHANPSVPEGAFSVFAIGAGLLSVYGGYAMYGSEVRPGFRAQRLIETFELEAPANPVVPEGTLDIPIYISPNEPIEPNSLELRVESFSLESNADSADLREVWCREACELTERDDVVEALQQGEEIRIEPQIELPRDDNQFVDLEGKPREWAAILALELADGGERVDFVELDAGFDDLDGNRTPW